VAVDQNCRLLTEWEMKEIIEILKNEGIVSHDIADLQNCTVKWTTSFLRCQCTLSGLSSLALGVACRDCSKQTVLSFVQRKLASWPKETQERVSRRIYSLSATSSEEVRRSIPMEKKDIQIVGSYEEATVIAGALRPYDGWCQTIGAHVPHLPKFKIAKTKDGYQIETWYICTGCGGVKG